ncbi:MAG: DNA phosphorothioation system sulfurtransferase DndC [Myxococcales bacterium]|nr:DNA phosphorothioation system sulfurtransferase DndC [Myxococcales bacterium]
MVQNEPTSDAHALLNQLVAIRADLADEYAQPHAYPWVIGFSGGKDSTLVLQLVLEMLLELPPSQRTRHVHVLSNDTLVESPIVQAFVDETLERVRLAVKDLKLPVTVAKTQPDLDQTFWVNLLGRGYPAPSRTFRWCTDRMKIRPTTGYLQHLIAEGGKAILLLGVRRAESAARARTVARYDNGERLNNHNDVANCMVYRPIVELTTDDVWTVLMQVRPPWGGTHRKLVTLYRNAGGGECPFVVDQADTPSCGTSSSRFGCWTCTVVEKDKSLEGFIKVGNEHLEPLVDFRDMLQEYSRDRSKRMEERRNGQASAGPFTMAVRRELLGCVRELEREVGFSVITDAEIERIEAIWREDESMLTRRQAKRLLDIVQDT